MLREPKIFISHKTSDRQIATELKKFVDRWSQREILVFQSSDPLAQGPRLGERLTGELERWLWETSVLFLVYTSEDQDWKWCMWECGVANKPPDTPRTRIVVLQCGATTPKVFSDQVHVDVRNPDHILKLVKEFLTDPDFFPGWGKALAPKFQAEDVKEAADYLHAKLAAVIPKGEIAEWPVQPFVRMELKNEKLKKLTISSAPESNLESSILIREMDSHARHIFGLGNLDIEMSLETLVKHWAQARPDGSVDWLRDLYDQIARAAHDEMPAPAWMQLEAASGPERYAPVVTRIRHVPAQDVCQFDVTLLPFESTRVFSGIGDRYELEFQNAKQEVDRLSQPLRPYLVPIAKRSFDAWVETVRGVLSDRGVEMDGPQRLEITRLLVHATKKHTLIERVIGNPEVMHSRDWLAFYEELGEHKETDKVWIICVEDSEVRSRITEVEAAWRFFRKCNFKTRSCSPRDLERAIGRTIDKAVWGRQVIEDFGAYLKLVALPGGSYTAGEVPNVLVTTFRVANSADRALMRSMMDCSREITEDWFSR